jgi:hypothetical protein
VRGAELAALIEQYRTGLEAELVLIVRLQGVAQRQHEATAIGDIDALQSAADQRDTLTSELLTIGQQIRPLHERLMHERTAALPLPGYSHAISLHQTVTQMVRDILDTDRESIRALEVIVEARRTAARTAAHAAEQVEATLAAYSRTVAAPPPVATLLNRTG